MHPPPPNNLMKQLGTLFISRILGQCLISQNLTEENNTI